VNIRIILLYYRIDRGHEILQCIAIDDLCFENAFGNVAL
jgi:hypothetical protein